MVSMVGVKKILNLKETMLLTWKYLEKLIVCKNSVANNLRHLKCSSNYKLIHWSDKPLINYRLIKA